MKKEYIETFNIKNEKELKNVLESIQKCSFLEEPAYYYGKEYTVKSFINSAVGYLFPEIVIDPDGGDMPKALVFLGCLDEEDIEIYELSKEDIEKIKSEYDPYYYGTEQGYVNAYNSILAVVWQWTNIDVPTLELKPDFSKVPKEEIEELISLKDKAEEDYDYQSEYEDKAEAIAEKIGFRVDDYCPDDLAGTVTEMLKAQ